MTDSEEPEDVELETAVVVNYRDNMGYITAKAADGEMPEIDVGDELVRREDAVNHGAEKWEKAREYERNRVCRSFKDWMEEENPSQEEILEKFEEWGALDSKEKPGEVDE